MKKMCKFWSCLLTKKGKVVWDKNKSTHEDLIKKANLKDNKLEDREFIRIEITPKEIIGIFSKNKKDWKYIVDEKGTLPNWYKEEEGYFKEIIWKEWQKVMKQTLWKLDLKSAGKFVNSIPKIKYFSMKGKIKKEWKMFYGETWYAAWNAAGDAAGDAAWNAAGDAAWNAAGDAAWNAAWGAAGDAVLFCRISLISKLGIEKKHIVHAKARMEVWKRGYGLKCDVNGKLYVYGIKKSK